MLNLDLMRVGDPVRGVYKGTLPYRMRFLNAHAIDGWLAIRDSVVLSDMWRSPEASLQAMQKKRGVQPPGYSRHGFGLAVDLDVGDTMKRMGIKKKAELDLWMEVRGWWCHRLDHKLEIEAWHYNFFGIHFARWWRSTDKSTAAAGERQLVELFGDRFSLKPHDLQEHLRELGYYGGAVDGKLGPLSRAAGAAFCRAWLLPGATPLSSARLQRTLAFVVAAKRFRAVNR